METVMRKGGWDREYGLERRQKRDLRPPRASLTRSMFGLWWKKIHLNPNRDGEEVNLDEGGNGSRRRILIH
ncbi:hypothetical protein LIA77_11513 [Sarocladium implicatum]|nr:hypothetical protein LIA77_11513 [Sarocladium implicatum]